MSNSTVVTENADGTLTVWGESRTFPTSQVISWEGKTERSFSFAASPSTLLLRRCLRLPRGRRSPPRLHPRLVQPGDRLDAQRDPLQEPQQPAPHRLPGHVRQRRKNLARISGHATDQYATRR